MNPYTLIDWESVIHDRPYRSLGQLTFDINRSTIPTVIRISVSMRTRVTDEPVTAVAYLRSSGYEWAVQSPSIPVPVLRAFLDWLR